MKEMRRVLALMLCVMMLVGYPPVGALAADDVQAATETSEPVTESSEPAQEESEEREEPSKSTEESSETTEEPAEEWKSFSITSGSFSALTGTTATSSAKVTDTYTASSTGETVLDAAIFCSDLHGESANLVSILGQVKNSGVTYSSVGLVGDV